MSIIGAVWLVSSFCFPQVPFSWYAWPLPLFVLVFSSWFASGAWAQLYRYLRETNPIQRQQTKWVVFGFTFAVAGRILFAAAGVFLPILHTDPWFNAVWLVVSVHLLWLCLLLVPVTFTVAILRYRLWGIDLIIRRTLLYATMTVLLALVYFSSVVVLQRLLQTFSRQAQNQLVTVLSTLAIATLFTPLRRHLQAAIDRRFYRRKYNTEQVLATFSATIRHETNLEQLTGRLLTVVAETIEPAQVSLWLKPTQEH